MHYNEKYGEVMSKKTIAKFCVFVIFAAVSAGCGYLGADGRENPQFDQEASPYGAPKQVGHLESKDIKEASGLASSKCQPDVLWTQNDSGDDAFIFAISTTGKHLGTWKVAGATNLDWEDISSVKTASGECKIYIGDIGNNGKEKGQGTIYRITEPKIDAAAATSDKKAPLATEPAEALQYSLDTKSDAETLLVGPGGGELYILTKRKEGPSVVYKLPANFGGGAQGLKISEITLPAILTGLLTGGDVSPDGKRVVLCDYVSGYELSLPTGAKNFDEIFKQKPVRFDIGKREVGEAVAYSPDGNSVFSISEGIGAPIFEAKRRN
jgi:hypothetical protein